LKLFRIFKELRKLLQMMGSCFKTLFWSTLLLILVMTVWACIAVEVIHPHMRELDARGAFSSCDRCVDAFSSVFRANLTLFQTIIAGDSWGQVAVPVIEAHPWTAIFFAGSLMTLIFGVLNLIVAVIVDSFAEMRAKDVSSLAKDMEYEEVEEKANLRKLFRKIDWNHDGALSYAELLHAAERLGDFRAYLRVLDVDKKDLQHLFAMVDADSNGAIDPKEFIETMYRLKNAESKTASKFIHHIVTNVHKQTSSVDERLAQIDASFKKFENALEQQAEINSQQPSSKSTSFSSFFDDFEQGPLPRSPRMALRQAHVEWMRQASTESTSQQHPCESFSKGAMDVVCSQTSAENSFDAGLESAPESSRLPICVSAREASGSRVIPLRTSAGACANGRERDRRGSAGKKCAVSHPALNGDQLDSNVSRLSRRLPTPTLLQHRNSPNANLPTCLPENDAVGCKSTRH